MGIIDGILGAGSNLITSRTQSRTAKYNTDRTIQANKELAEYQFSKNLEMWNKGNAYDSPEAQMERLKAAGLNPNLIYGTGNVTGNSSGTLPQYNAPTVKYDYKAPVDWGSVMSGFQDVQLKQAQIDNVKAQTEATQAMADLRLLDKDYTEAIQTDRATRYITETQAKTAENQMKTLKGEWQFNNFDKLKEAWQSELTRTNANAQTAVFDKQIKGVAARYAKAASLVNMITKGVATGAGAIGLAGILKNFNSAGHAAKLSQPLKSRVYYNYK